MSTQARLTGFRLSPELLDALQAIKERDGIPISEQVRRALAKWVEERAIATGKAARKRAGTRKQA